MQLCIQQGCLMIWKPLLMLRLTEGSLSARSPCLGFEQIVTFSLFESLPSANKILQPLDTHIVSTGQYTLSNPKFVSKSSHLCNAMAMQEMCDLPSQFFFASSSLLCTVIQASPKSSLADRTRSIGTSLSVDWGQTVVTVGEKFTWRSFGKRRA